MKNFTSLRSSLVSLLSVLTFLASAAAVQAAVPTISAVSPATASANLPVTLTASVSAAAGIQSCNLYVDLDDVGSMTVAGGTASKSYTFPSGGSRIAFVFCRDLDGHANSGSYTSLWVDGAIVSSSPLSGNGAAAPTIQTPITPTPTPTPTPPAPTGPAAGSLIKLACTATPDANDPCTAVYYLGQDAKRHAFPNAKVYFTWYTNFDSVITVSSTVMGNLTIGKNVTYRPGVRLVKFTTVNKVYAVSKTGGLRWLKDELTAAALFGPDWTTKVDDLDDTLYSNYQFGPMISSVNDYSVTAEMDAAKLIDHIL